MSVPTPLLLFNLSDATMKGLLPAGYTPLAYIESTGTLWINSGVALNGATSTYILSCKIGASTRDSHAHSFFGTASYLTGMMGIYHYTNNNYYSEYIANADKGAQNKVILKGNIFEYYLKMNMSAKTYASRIGDSSEVTGSFNALSDTTTTIRVFKSDDYPGGYWKCYYFRIAKDNVLQVDLIPARRDSDGVIGMYDLVSRTFKTNSGSGTFIAGPELAVGKGGGKSLPEEYLLVEYLYNEDKTSWINFNRTLKSNTIMKVNMQVVSYLTGAVYQQIMGYATNTSWNPYSLGIYNNVFTLYSGTVDSTALPTSNFRQVVWTNSVETIETSGSTLGLFHMAGSPGDYANAGIKVQCCQILEGSSIIIKAFPCYRKSDMKPGMYDVVNGVFYTNAGSGEFILGPTVTNYYSCEPNGSGKAALNPYDTTIYTESDGSRWMRIFHHNNPANSRFATGVNLANNVYESADKWSCIQLINKDLGNWEFMLKQKDTSSSSEVKYRWIQYYNPFTANWSLVLPGNVLNVSGYSGTQGGMWAMNSSDTYFVIANTSSGNWFGAIGGKTVYNGGIPGYPNTTCTTGYMDLYVRIDNNASFEPIGLYNNVSCAYDSRFNYVSSFSGSSWIDIGTILNGRSVKNTTTALWVNTDTQSGAILLAGSLHGSSQRYYIGRYNGLYDFGLGGTGWVGGISGASATVGSWAFLVLTIDSSGIPRFYYNGTLVATREAVNYNFSGNFLIGCANANESYFQGKIYNFMFFNTALTAAQIKELYGG